MKKGKISLLVVSRWQIVSQIIPPCELHVFQEEGLNMNWQLNQDSSMVEYQARDLEVRVQVLVQVQI